jgi:hypothetical protein
MGDDEVTQGEDCVDWVDPEHLPPTSVPVISVDLEA